MAIHEVNEIDLKGVNSETGEIILSIIDDYDWKDEKMHLYLLKEKVYQYLNFIQSGEIYLSYPNSENKEIEILILAKYDIPNNRVANLSQLSSIVIDNGFKFCWELIS